MKVKKFLMIFSTVLLGTTLLVGCGKEKTAKAANDNITLRISWWGNDERHKATLAAIKHFEEDNPNIQVKSEYSGFDGVEQKIATQMSGNTEPDIMQMNSSWLDLYSPDGSGYYDLSKLKEIDLTGYDETALKQGQINGIQNAVPYCVNTWVMGINKTAFDKNGVEIPKTWDGYIEAAKHFAKGTYPVQLSSSDLQIYLQQMTGKSFVSDDGKINYSEETLVDGLNWYKKMVDEKVTPPLQEIKEEAAAAGSGVPSKKFLNGDYAGTTQWSATIGNDYLNLKETGQELIVAHYPTIKEGDAAYVLQSIMPFGISKNTKHPKEAAKLLNYLINDKNGVEDMGLTRGIPANQHAYKLLSDAGQIDDISKQVVEYTNQTDTMPKNTYLKMPMIQTIFDENFESFALGKTNAKDTAHEIYQKMQDAIKQFNSTR
jgi:oligogalacturonide transport system substrate-binding protein